MNETDLKRIADGLSEIDSPLELVMYEGEEEQILFGQLSDLAQQIVEACQSSVLIGPPAKDLLPARPGMCLSYENRRNIRYLALPVGLELAPFIEALLGMPKGKPSGSEGAVSDWASELSKLDEAVELLVFIGESCPNCPRAVLAAIQLGLANAKVSVTIVDAQRFPELAKKYNVSSVPMTIVDGGLSLVGVEKEERLVELLLDRKGSSFSKLEFQSFLESGRMADAVAQLVSGAALASFGVLWKESVTSSRMGLMVAAEEALEEKRECLDGLVDELVGILAVDDAALRGDTADLLGRIGCKEATEALKKLLDDPNADVAEIAEEAIEEIANRE